MTCNRKITKPDQKPSNRSLFWPTLVQVVFVTCNTRLTKFTSLACPLLPFQPHLSLARLPKGAQFANSLTHSSMQWIHPGFWPQPWHLVVASDLGEGPHPTSLSLGNYELGLCPLPLRGTMWIKWDPAWNAPRQGCTCEECSAYGHPHPPTLPVQKSHFSLSSENEGETPLQEFLKDFPGGSVVKSLPANAGDLVSISDPGRSHMPWSNQACAPQLLSLCSRAWEQQTTEVRVP